jgi:hypothetical protein
MKDKYMRHDGSWSIMKYHEISWNIMKPYEGLQPEEAQLSVYKKHDGHKICKRWWMSDNNLRHRETKTWRQLISTQYEVLQRMMIDLVWEFTLNELSHYFSNEFLQWLIENANTQDFAKMNINQLALLNQQFSIVMFNYHCVCNKVCWSNGMPISMFHNFRHKSKLNTRACE